MRKLFLLIVALSMAIISYSQGTTTSSMSGTVTEAGGESVIGANLVAVHTPTGTVYGTITDLDGSYRIPNMRIGGPYSLTVSFVGFGEQKIEGITLRLGENFKYNFDLSQSAIELSEIQIVAKAGTVGQNVGASTQITSEDIELMPTINRDINDFLRLTPQSSAFGDGASFAGVNNRFNAIYIDGAVNNDVFGLASSGTNGGQTGISPFSIDIIDQLQVVLSPYDVSLGGFAGAGVNAVTKSGSNKLAGTAYYFMQNESIAGKTNGALAERLGLTSDQRTRLNDFSKKTFGASLGGALVKDKIFFYTNVEIQDDVTPTPFETSIYTSTPGRASVADLNNLSNFLINTHKYDPGTFGSTSDDLKGLKVFGKLDFNLNENNKLTLRHQYTKAEQYDRNGGSSSTLNFSNNGVFFPSTTNSSALELNTKVSNDMANNLIIGYTSVNDDRGSLGTDFPQVIIEDASSGIIQLGTEAFSTGNVLNQKIFTITDNFKIYKGKHTFTIGTHNEFYSMNNVFIPQNFGVYRFGSINDFITGKPAKEYDRSYSLVDDVTGDKSKAAAQFNAMQLGFYGQDEIQLSSKLNITAGLRIDIPIISDDPVEDTYFNSTALPKIQSAYPIAEGVKAGSAPDGQIMFSPRFGFEYDMNEDRKTIIRGGIGIFTSRIPFVWPGAMFNNNGLTQGFVDERGITGPVSFRADINNQYTNPNFKVPSGQMDLFVKDFKYPQVLRMNLAMDKALEGGWDISLEGIYTKTLNNIVYTNVNSNPAISFNWVGKDTRPVFGRANIDNTYSAVYVGSNTSEGYTYNLTASIAKNFSNGLNANLSYNYGDAFAVNEGTSSQNSSQWRGQTSIDGRNTPVYGRSDYSMGHRILGALNYKLKWGSTGSSATTFSLFYNGQSGTAFSYVIAGSNGRNPNNETGSTSRNRSLVYVPATQSDINLVSYTSGGVTVTATQQWAALDALIESDPSLKSRRGQYAEKNGARAPFESILDLAIRQDFGKDLGGNLHKFQISLDIFNFSNMIHKNWGVRYFVPGDFNNYFLTQLEGYEADKKTPRFTYRGTKLGEEAFDISGTSSRWRMRLGFRYIFN